MTTIMDTMIDNRELEEEGKRVAFNLQTWGATKVERKLGEFLDVADIEWLTIIKDGDPLLWGRWDCELDEYGRLV